jgi:hypothetical protein
MQVTPVYMELVDFIAAGLSPERIAAYHPSDAAQERVMGLLQRQKDRGAAAAGGIRAGRVSPAGTLHAPHQGPRQAAPLCVSGTYITAMLRREVVRRAG